MGETDELQWGISISPPTIYSGRVHCAPLGGSDYVFIYLFKNYTITQPIFGIKDRLNIHFINGLYLIVQVIL